MREGCKLSWEVAKFTLQVRPIGRGGKTPSHSSFRLHWKNFFKQWLMMEHKFSFPWRGFPKLTIISYWKHWKKWLFESDTQKVILSTSQAFNTNKAIPSQKFQKWTKDIVKFAIAFMFFGYISSINLLLKIPVLPNHSGFAESLQFCWNNSTTFKVFSVKLKFPAQKMNVYFDLWLLLLIFLVWELALHHRDRVRGREKHVQRWIHRPESFVQILSRKMLERLSAQNGTQPRRWPLDVQGESCVPFKPLKSNALQFLLTYINVNLIGLH